MHHATFNADFYVTAATVIPLFYVALTLEGETFAQLLTRLIKNASLEDVAHLFGSGKYSAILISRLFILIGSIFAAVAIVVGGIAGEFYAFMALYKRSGNFLVPIWPVAGVPVQRFVFFSVGALLLVVAVGPVRDAFVAFGLALYENIRSAYAILRANFRVPATHHESPRHEIDRSSEDHEHRE